MELEKIRLRYRPGLPFVLRDVSVRIQAKEKVGIVGRTGSGEFAFSNVPSYIIARGVDLQVRGEKLISPPSLEMSD